jgi:hypothetical protein
MTASSSRSDTYADMSHLIPARPADRRGRA